MNSDYILPIFSVIKGNSYILLVRHQLEVSVLPFRLYLCVRSCFRFILWTVNNFYCIPVHFCWLLVLQPLKWISESTYWLLEGVMFRWLLSMVALWSYSAGYHIIELGDDVSFSKV